MKTIVSMFPRWFVAPDEGSRPETSQGEGFGARVLDRIREGYCGLHGHDSLLSFQQDRLFLKCVSCGHETPGWSLSKTRPQIVARPDSRRRALVAPRLIGARRVA
jgi:hypothetical protein